VAETSVLIVGLEPSLIDFSDPAHGASGLDAAAVRVGLEANQAHLNALAMTPKCVSPTLARRQRRCCADG
jgi:hypothetical protein